MIHGKRSSNLKQSFSKFIEEFNKSQIDVMSKMTEKNPNDSYSLTAHSDFQQPSNFSLENISEKFKNIFIEHLKKTKIVQKVDLLEEQIKRKKNNKRDINNKYYIKEIFESYLTDSMDKLGTNLENLEKKILNRNSEIKTEIQILKEKIEEEEKRLSENERSYEELVKNYNDICEN